MQLKQKNSLYLLHVSDYLLARQLLQSKKVTRRTNKNVLCRSGTGLKVAFFWWGNYFTKTDISSGKATSDNNNRRRPNRLKRCVYANEADGCLLT